MNWPSYEEVVKKKTPAKAGATSVWPKFEEVVKPKPPVFNQFGLDVSTHIMNPLNPDNQIPKLSDKQKTYTKINRGLDELSRSILPSGLVEATDPKKSTGSAVGSFFKGLGQAVISIPEAIAKQTKGFFNEATGNISDIMVGKGGQVSAPYSDVTKGADEALRANPNDQSPLAQGDRIANAFLGGLSQTLPEVGILGGVLKTPGGAPLADRASTILLGQDVGAGKVRTSKQPAPVQHAVVPDRVAHTTTGDKTYYTIPTQTATEIIDKVDNSRTGFTAKNDTGDNLHITAKTPQDLEALGYKHGGDITPDKIIGPDTKSSRVGKSLETKAIEKGLTTEFKDVAGYDPITIKEQAQLASDLLKNDFERARRMVSGDEPLPSNLRGGSLLKAMEDFAFEKNDARLVADLANSHLASETSRFAQELRTLAERNPDSPVTILRQLKASREKAFSTKQGDVGKAKAKVVKEIKAEVKPISKDAWGAFIESIKC